MNYIKKVKKIRDKQRLNQKEFAEKIGVSVSAVKNFEAGKTKLSVDMLIAIAKNMDIDIYDFLHLKNPHLEIHKQWAEQDEETLDFQCMSLTMVGLSELQNKGIIDKRNPKAERALYKFLNTFKKYPQDSAWINLMDKLADVCILDKTE